MTGRLLVATAVEVEAQAVRAGCLRSDPSAARVHVAVVGVGQAAAAAGTARLLALAESAGTPYRAVVSAGIGGGFPGRTPVGAIAVGARSIAADLGAETPDGFLPLDVLGFGTSTLDADKALLTALLDALATGPQGDSVGAPTVGDILTVNTVTGSTATAARLCSRYPHAVAEAMEGYGVACAAAAATVPFAELRTISNPVGPRDRAAWRIPEALGALTLAATAFPALLLPAS